MSIDGQAFRVTRRTALQVVGVAGAAMLLSACTPRQGTTGSSTGAVPFFSAESNPPAIEQLEKFVSTYNAQGKAEINMSLAGGGSSRGEILIRKFQLKQEIGVFELEDAYLEDWAKANYLEPLDDLLDDLGEDFFIDQSYFRSAYDGHVYGLPMQINPAVTYYRTDLFKAKGLRAPTNFDELLECSKALTSGDSYGISLALGPNAASGMALTPVLHQAGADYFDRQGNLTFDSAEARKGLLNHLELLKYAPVGIAAWGYVDVLNAFLGGNVGIMHAPSQYLATILRDYPDLAKNIGVLPISPFGGPLNGQTAWGRWQQLGISSNTKNIDGAKAFLKFLLSSDNRAKWITASPGLVAPIAEANDHVSKDKDYAATFGKLVTPAFAAGKVAVTPVRNMGSVFAGAFVKSSVICPWAASIWGAKPVDIEMLQKITLNNIPFDDAWHEASASMGQIAHDWRAANPDWNPGA